MSNNSSSPKGQKTKLIVFLASWAAEMQFEQSPKDVLENLKLLKITYLQHEWADDREERIQVLHVFEQLEHLMENLASHDTQDFEDLDLFVLNLAS